jgi:PAS domain S-box-containing protein
MSDPAERPELVGSNEDIDHEIRAALRRISELRSRADEPATESSEPVTQSSEPAVGESSPELLLMLETLRLAEEELRAQNEALELVQDRLAEERQRYVELFEGAPDAMLETDPLGMVRDANMAAVELLGCPAEVLHDKPLVMFFADEERARFCRLLTELRGAEHRGEWMGRLRPYRRAPFPVALTVRVARTPRGAPRAIRWALRDVADRVQGEDSGDAG